MAVVNMGNLSISTSIAQVTTGLKWKAVGVSRPTTGTEYHNAKLAQALLKKKEFIAYEFAEFGVSEQLPTNCYVQAGDTYFQPTGISGDRYNVRLSKVNVHLCSTDNFEDNTWEDAQFKIFQTPVTVELEIDKPSLDHPQLTVGVLVAAIDAEVTKAHVLHSCAIQDTLNEMFPTSEDEKTRKKKEQQKQQIQRHKIGLVRQDIKTKLANLEERSAGPDGEVEKAKVDAKKMEVKVIVERLSITFKATDKEAEEGDIWSRRVSPEQSLRLEVVDCEMHLSTWDSKASVLMARLHTLSVEHFGQDTSGAIKILRSKKENVSMRRLLQVATMLEEAFLVHDKDKSGSLDLSEVRGMMANMGTPVSDEQLAVLKRKLDADGNGTIEVGEFVQLAPMLCSRSAESLDGVDFTMPLPSDLAQQPEMELLRVTIENRADIIRASFKLGRVELTISSIPLRNAFDWMHLLQGASAQTSAGARAVSSSSIDEDTQELSFEEEKTPGIAALRKSFESESEDIYVPPTLSSIYLVDIEEIDVAVHDSVIGSEEVLFFRAGPLSLALSVKTPMDDKEPYQSKMQVLLKRLRVLYGQNLQDMEWDLTEVVSETALTFSSEDSMPQDLSGAIKEQRMEIPDNGVRLAVSLKELLFLQALQKTFSTVSQGIAGLEALAQAEQPAIRQTSSKLSRGQSSKLMRGQSSINMGSGTDGKARGKFQRNIAKLVRSFKCPTIELDVIDDLPEVQDEQDANAVISTVKLVQCRMSQFSVSESLGDKDHKIIARIAGFDVQAQAVGNTGNMETLLEPFPLRLEISTSRYSSQQKIVFEIPSGLEMTMTPDHIERPRETKQKFQRHIKKQQLLLNLTIKANVQKSLEKLGGEVKEEEGYRNKMLTFLSSLSPGEKRHIQNRTNVPILCRVYPAADCDTLKQPLIQFVLPPGGGHTAPTQVLSSGVLIMQPCRSAPVAPTDTSEGLVWLSLGSTEPNTGEQLENASLADALTRKTRFTAEELKTFGIKNLRVEHFVKASTGFYFKPAPLIQWAIGTWSKPEELCLEPTEAAKGARFTASVEMEVQICMEASKVTSIMTDKGPQFSFKLDFEKAVRSGADKIKEVKHRGFRRAGADLLVVGFAAALGSDSEMGGILMDFGDALTHQRLAEALKRFKLIAHEDDLSVLKEATFERIIDCTSNQMTDATFMVASGLKQVHVTAPWKLSNKLPKPARFCVYTSDDPNVAPITTELLEPGQKMMRYSPLTSEAGVWIEIELDGYRSARHYLVRESRHEECPLLQEDGDRICCMLDAGIVGHSAEFVVNFYMKMVIINRTGLNLSFGCCRFAGRQDRGDKTNKAERAQDRLLPRARTDQGLMTRGKSMSRQGNDWVIKHSLESEANPWNKKDPEITMLHLPENLRGEDAWRPCLNMAGVDAWTEIQATHSVSEDQDQLLDDEDDDEEDEIFDVKIPGPPASDGPQDSNFTYRVGVLRKRGITPFQCTTYLTLLPKYTLVNDTGLSVQICQAGESIFKEQVLVEIRDGKSMSTLGLFREPHSAGPKVANKNKIRIRLLEEDGSPRTKWSHDFGIDEVRSVPLRLLHNDRDLATAVENATQCVITIRTWEAATFVEMRNVKFIEPMYQIKNSCVKSKLKMRIWQPAPASPLGRHIYMCVCVCVCVYVYIYMYIYVHIYMYIYICFCWIQHFFIRPFGSRRTTCAHSFASNCGRRIVRTR